MKAYVFASKKHGGGLVPADVPVPSPLRGEVLVRVKAMSLNAGDWRMLGLGVKPSSGIPGSAVAGLVEAVGEGVATFRPGDAVAGDLSASGCGALSEFARAPERELARIPAGLSYEEAAACPVAGVTALQALRDAGRVRSGDSVLIVGAGGGVGSFAVQIAAQLGARVAAVCGADCAGQALSLGARKAYDYRATRPADWDGPYDLIVAVHGGGSPWLYRCLLAAGGRIVHVGGSLPSILASLALGPILSLGREKTRTLVSIPKAADLAVVLGMASEGMIKPAIEAVKDFSDAAAAFAMASGGHARGKIVVRISDSGARHDQR
jgi:NADPH:quinone reductase-like Zn-dependent oxidoreductase